MKWIVFILSVLAIAGCQDSNQTSLDPTIEGFFTEDTTETPKPQQFAQLHAAAGARFDAMLGKAHFDGAALNSLGEEKLNDMLKDDDSPGPLSVYLTVDGKDNLARAREAAVVTFLKDRGLKENQITVTFGTNPKATTPVARGLRDLNKADSTDASGGQSPREAPAGASNGGSDAGTALVGSSMK